MDAQTMVEASRNGAWTRLQEAEQLRLQRRFDRAQAVCESLVREHPDYMGALHTLGLIFGDQKKYEEALDCLVRASMLDPNSWTTLTALSEVYLRLGSPEMAARTIQQARLIKPAEPKVLVAVADIHMGNCDYELARDAYREALMHQRDFVPAAIGLGWACENLGEYKTAAEIFESLIKRGFTAVEPMRALAVLP